MDKIVGHTEYKTSQESGWLEAKGPRSRTCTIFKELKDIVIIIPKLSLLGMEREIHIPIEILSQLLKEAE